MKTDVTTKVLLALIALALWALLLKPAFTPISAQAAQEATAGRPALAAGEKFLWVAADGRIYKFDTNLGRPDAIGVYGPNVTPKGK